MRFLTPLGLLNFLLLQWFFIRLARVKCRRCRGIKYRCEKHDPWVVLKWVYPMTGWFSPYRIVGEGKL